MGQKQRQMHGRRGGPGMGGPADRSKDFKGAWMNLLRYCKKEWLCVGLCHGWNHSDADWAGSFVRSDRFDSGWNYDRN